MRTRSRLAAALLVGAVLLAGPSAMAAGVDPTTATAPEKEQAQAHFAAAHNLFEEKQYAEALGEAKASWNIVASPNSRLFIARCLTEMGKPVEAYLEYSGTIVDANALVPKEARYADTAKAATDERTAIESRIGLLTVTIDHPTADTQVTVAGAPLDKTAWSTAVPVVPGSVDVDVQAGGKDLGKQTVMVAAGEKKTVEVDANPPPPPVANTSTDTDSDDQAEAARKAARKRRAAMVPTVASGRESLRPVAYVAAGVGVVGFVLFGVFGAMEKSTYSSLQTACPNNMCPPSQSSDISSGKTQELVANIGLGVGIVGIAAGATLFALSFGGKHAGAQSGAQTMGSTSLVFTPSFIGLRGAL